MPVRPVKITSKGQATIPKEIRDILQTNTVYFEIVGNTIVVRPVRDAAGSLSEYARNVKAGAPFQKVKERAWEEAVREKAGKKSS